MLHARLFMGVAVTLAAWLAGAPVFAASDKDKAKPNPEATAKEAAPKKEAEPVSAEPQLTTASFGDWVERCQRLPGPGDVRKVCEVALAVTATGQNAPLAEIAIGRVRKTDPMRLTLVLPVNVAFPSAPRITLEGEAPVDLVWKQCVPAGCFADAVFGADQQIALHDAKSAKIESKAAGGQSFNFAVSLHGLPQALDALAKEP